MYVYVSCVQKLSEYGQNLFIKILLYEEESKTNISWTKKKLQEKLLSICGSSDQNYYIFGSMLYYDLSTLSKNYFWVQQMSVFKSRSGTPEEDMYTCRYVNR